MKLENKNIRKQIIKLAWPAILEMMLHTLVWTADTAMVGRLNPVAISSVNLSSQIMFTVSNILGAFGIGATAMVSRYIGSKDRQRAEEIASQAVGFSILIGLSVGILGIFSTDTLFKWIVNDTEVINQGTMYLKIVYIGAIFLIPLMVGNAVLRGAGNTVIPLVAAAFANVFNIIGDYLLIFGKFGFPEMGVKGAAIATGSAQIVGALVTFFFLIRGKSGIKIDIVKIFVFKLESLKKLIKLSVPAIFEMLMNEGSRLVSSFWIAQLGTVAFAAHSLAVAAESISFMPGLGFAIAATTLVGQNLGSENVEKAELSAKKSTEYGVFFMGLIGIVFFVFPFQIMRLFSTDLKTVGLAAQCIRVGAFEQIPMALGMVMSGALKGAGDTRGPFKISLITNLLVRMPLIFIVVFIIKGHIAYVWAITAFQFLVEGTLMTIRYKKGNWKKIKIE